jgi:hypothetical protein
MSHHAQKGRIFFICVPLKTKSLVSLENFLEASTIVICQAQAMNPNSSWKYKLKNPKVTWLILEKP